MDYYNVYEDPAENGNSVMEMLAKNNSANAAVASPPDYSVPVIMSIIVCLGLIFNTIAITINCVLEDYKKTSHWYVLNLAVADTIFLLLMPAGIIERLAGSWNLGEPLCVAYNSMFYANYYAGIFFLTVMSFDRFVAILFPMSSFWRRFRSNEGCWVATVVVWIVAILASLPLILNTRVRPNLRGGFDIPGNTNHCDVIFHHDENEANILRSGLSLEDEEQINEHEDMFSDQLWNMTDDEDDSKMKNAYDFAKISGSGMPDFPPFESSDSFCQDPPYPAYIKWVYINFFLTYAIPIVVMVMCYGCILWRVLHPRIQSSGNRYRKGSVKSFLSENGKASTKTVGQKNNNRLTVIVILLVTAFLGCWTPFHAVKMAKIRGVPLKPHKCNLIEDVAKVMAFSSCLLNPLLYTFLGANFHKRAGKVWSRIKAKNSATKEFFATFRNSKTSARNSTVRSNKSSTSDGGIPTNTNTRGPPPPYKPEQSSCV